MILYHYSVDSYKEGKSLTNDYKKGYRFAEPFLLALKDGEETFRATYYATMYMGRELVALGLRKYENYQKDAVEAIFEYVRELEFPDEPGRLKCVYYCHSEEEAIAYAMDDCIKSGLFTKEQVVLLEVEVEDDRIREYDQHFYNLAMDAIDDMDFDAVFEYAKKYYGGEKSMEPVIEVLSDGENLVLRRVEY